jgi:uncharacterized protein (TIGR02147 family)
MVEPAYSHRRFLADAEIAGSTYLLRVLRSERKLSPKYIVNFSTALGHTSSEAHFFERLVRFGNEKNVDRKEHLLKELLKIRAERTTASLEDKKLRYFEKWYYPVIRDLVGLVDFGDDYQALGRMLVPPVKAAQAESAVMFLLSNGFIRKRENGAGYEPSEPILSTPPSVNSTVLNRFHRKNLELDIEALENGTLSDRSISSVIMSVSEETFEKMRLEVQDFRKRLIALARESRNPDRVVRTGFQLVLRAEVRKKDR